MAFDQVQVQAGPTKRFFVGMLTRDIDLRDAVLDLLDNCIDGVQRQIKGRAVSQDAPYEGYWAKISVTDDSFTIEDNCGGIPKDIAISSAFRLGRPEVDRDNDIPTVGMYGIGMKRAIFKMGRHAIVHSRTDADEYAVEITSEWLSDEGSWLLPLVEKRGVLEHRGTKIHIERLHEPIASEFRTTFVDDLSKEIKKLFSIIIGKGFTIWLNDVRIEPANIKLLYSSDLRSQSIEPYVFEGDIMGVHVLVVVGFYRPLATDEEVEQEQDTPKSQSGQAGWNVICNDRLVLHADKSPVTGWGLKNIPRYHTQFIAIGGTVEFTSTESDLLPLRTTKRGLNTSNEIYLIVLDYMMEGLRKFIDFTNKWKGQEEKTVPAFRSALSATPREIAAKFSAERDWSAVSRLTSVGTAKRFSPNLPMPQSKNPNRKIVFQRAEADIQLLADHFFEDAQARPSDVGARCFDECLEEIKRK